MLLKVIVIALLVTWVSSFLRFRRNDNLTCKKWLLSSTSTTITSMSSSPSLLVKKGKQKALDEVRKEIEKQGEDHIITKFVKRRERPDGIIPHPNFYNGIKNKFNTLSILVEYNKKAKTGFIIGMPPPEIMGGVIRDAGARAVVVAMDSRLGGVTPDLFLRFAKEQARARIQIPGPISLVWSDLVVDKLQVEYAAALGAAAITLYPEFVENLKDFVDTANQLDVEPIVMIKNVADGIAAVAAGARILCLHSLGESELVSIKKQLAAKLESDRPDILYVARFRPEGEYSSYYEIDLAWVLRDEGFHAVWPSPEAVFTTGMTDAYNVVSALRAKASRQFLSPRQYMMDRKKEGATEYLGDILY